MIEMKFKVEAFEGPLDLLLHLIKRLEIDIYDIPMTAITEQYMDFVHAMRQLELNMASEYLVMAATLLQIKSKMLLPKQELAVELDEETVEEDPREALVERLMEYKKYKEAAQALKEKEQERLHYFGKAPLNLCSQESTSENVTLELELADMLNAFQKLMRRQSLAKPLHTKITLPKISIDERMQEVITQMNKHVEKRLKFEQLIMKKTKTELVVTFLALLELMKRKNIMIEQTGNFSELYIRRREEVSL